MHNKRHAVLPRSMSKSSVTKRGPPSAQSPLEREQGQALR